MLCAKIHLDLCRTDRSHDTQNLISCIQSLDGLPQKLLKVLLCNSINISNFAHSLLDLLYYPRWCRRTRCDTDDIRALQPVRLQLGSVIHKHDVPAMPGTDVREASRVGAVLISDDNHRVTAGRKLRSLGLPILSRFAYCIKDFAICTHFFCDFLARFP